MESKQASTDDVTTIKRVLCGGLYQYTPSEIAAIRKKLKMSLVDFARLFFSSKSIVTKWETGERKPGGSSLRLLQFVETVANNKAPEINNRIRESYVKKYGEPVTP